MKYFIFVFVIFMLFSCGKKPLTTSTIPADYIDTISFKSQFVDNYDNVPYYQCDGYEAFTIKMNSRNVDSLYLGYFKCTIEPIINEWDSTIMDTVYTYSNQKNEIKIYKAKHDDFLTLYDVTDTMLVINGNIKPGMTKERFAKKFSIVGLTKDTVDIGNMEQTSIIRFYFHNDVLRRIKYEPYFE